MTTRENQPISNSYSRPASKEAAISSRLSNVTPLETEMLPQSKVVTKTPAVDADPRDPPELVRGSAETTSHRILSTPIDSQKGMNIKNIMVPKIRAPAKFQYHFNVGLLAFRSDASLVFVIPSPIPVTTHSHDGRLTAQWHHW
jgi:hypothetical protein